MRTRILKILLAVFCFVLLAFHLARPIVLTAVDIGRHVKNGELLLQGQWDVLYHNFYSFTHPNHPFINHHWFFGVMSYGVYKLAGFTGLSIVFIAVMLAALFFFLSAALARGRFALVMLLTAAALPLLSYRGEIRPEGISLLFMGMYFYFLTKLSLGKVRPGVVFAVLGTAQLIWVNTHIFFFMGPALVLVFLWEGKVRGCTVCVRRLRPLLALVTLVNVINPSGLAGALTPLNIFKGFGYRLAENQNAFFMISRFPGKSIYLYGLVLVIAFMALMLLSMFMRGFKRDAPFIVLGFFVSLAALKAVRLLSPFGFFFIPLGAYFAGQLEGRLNAGRQRALRAVFFCATAVLLLVFASDVKKEELGLGLIRGVNASAQFFRDNGLQGPIFSNYDIGGYLIYHLAGREKVFVDNRGEAFPPEFFKNVYVPMQEDEAVWNKVDGQYKFNTVYFYRHDLTPWGQGFLVGLIKNPDWAPVFVDGYTIIFAKRKGPNQRIIDRFELPRSMFGVSHP